MKPYPDVTFYDESEAQQRVYISSSLQHKPYSDLVNPLECHSHNTEIGKTQEYSSKPPHKLITVSDPM